MTFVDYYRSFEMLVLIAATVVAFLRVAGLLDTVGNDE